MTSVLPIGAGDNHPDLARKLITIAGRARQVVNTLRQVAPIAISYEGSPIELNEAAAVS